MRIGGGGSTNINLLQSDSGQFRNEDFDVDRNFAMAAGFSQAAVAAEYGRGQIYNPVGSGVSILIDRVTLGSTANTNVYLDHNNTELNTDVGAWVSKKNGGAAGSGHARSETDGTVAAGALGRIKVVASESVVLPLRWAILLAPGDGLMVSLSSVNIQGWFSFEGREF